MATAKGMNQLRNCSSGIENSETLFQLVDLTLANSRVQVPHHALKRLTTPSDFILDLHRGHEFKLFGGDAHFCL